MSNINPLRTLKVKVANLQVEIQALISKAESNPGLIDAIAADIADFTDEITKIRKELADLDTTPPDAPISLSEIYKEIKRKKK